MDISGSSKENSSNGYRSSKVGQKASKSSRLRSEEKKPTLTQRKPSICFSIGEQTSLQHADMLQRGTRTPGGSLRQRNGYIYA